jgi:hypothetical protein
MPVFSTTQMERDAFWAEVEEEKKEEFKEQGKQELAREIYALIKTYKNEDWRDVYAILEKHLKEEELCRI